MIIDDWKLLPAINLLAFKIRFLNSSSHRYQPSLYSQLPSRTCLIRGVVNILGAWLKILCAKCAIPHHICQLRHYCIGKIWWISQPATKLKSTNLKPFIHKGDCALQSKLVGMVFVLTLYPITRSHRVTQPSRLLFSFSFSNLSLMVGIQILSPYAVLHTSSIELD